MTCSLFNTPETLNLVFHIGSTFCLTFIINDNAGDPVTDFTNFTFRMQVRKGQGQKVIIDLRTPLSKALSDVSVDATAKTYTSAATNFVDFGIEVGDTVTWTGFANGGNNAALVVTTVAAGVLTFSGASGLVTEAAGASVNLSGPRGITITDGPNATFQIVISKAISESVHNDKSVNAFYDIFGESSVGDVTKIVEGKFDIKQRMTAIVAGTG